MANAAGVAAIGAVFFDRIESVEPGEDVCAVDYPCAAFLTWMRQVTA
jgi:hypothetical protein